MLYCSSNPVVGTRGVAVVRFCHTRYYPIAMDDEDEQLMVAHHHECIREHVITTMTRIQSLDPGAFLTGSGVLWAALGYPLSWTPHDFDVATSHEMFGLLVEELKESMTRVGCKGPRTIDFQTDDVDVWFQLYAVDDPLTSIALHDIDATRVWAKVVQQASGVPVLHVQFCDGVDPVAVITHHRAEYYGCVHVCRDDRLTTTTTGDGKPSRVVKYTKRGFSVSLGDPSIESVCPYCDTRMTSGGGEGGAFDNPQAWFSWH
jgi:hypothetical protein